jgi:hypothetical protein
MLRDRSLSIRIWVTAGRLRVGDESEPSFRMVRGCSMGVSDPEVRKKLSEPRWLQYKHQSDKQIWPWWKRLIHRFQRCPICKPAR